MSSLTPYASAPATTVAEFMTRKNIDAKYESTLELLGKREIVILADDSGSMSSRMKTADGYKTRWNEQKDLIKKIMEAAVLFDSNGFDLFFLNRGVVKGVKDVKSVEDCFNSDPTGGTPLLTRLGEAVNQVVPKLDGKKLMVYILTDGEPTDGDLETWLKTHYVSKTVLSGGKEQKVSDLVALQFVMCTDEKRIHEYYAEKIDNLGGNPDLPVNITIPYSEEKERVHQHNSRVNFTDGNYLLEILAGAIDPALDQLNDRKVAVKQGVIQTTQIQLEEPAGCGCIVS